MAYHDMAGEETAAPVRHRRASSSQTTTRRKRRKKRNPIRFDLIFLAAIALVVLVVILIPRQQIDTPTPSDTGATVRTPEPSEIETTESQPTEPPTTAYVPVPLTFTESDSELVYVRSICKGKADVEEALLAKLDWDLQDPDFTVLIIHSHISEGYTKVDGQEYSIKGGDPYRTDDERYNMVAVGQRLAQILEANGIRVIHDTTSFEKPNSDYAYSKARDHLEDLLAENSDIGLILDLHRDAVQNEDGTQWAPTVTVDGKKAAKISMLIGYSGSYDKMWDQNLSFAVKLGAQMNRNVEKTFRQLLINSSQTCYNQNLGPVSMLIEVGTAGNTLEEALNAAELLAQAVVDMTAGANIE